MPEAALNRSWVIPEFKVMYRVLDHANWERASLPWRSAVAHYVV